jgi:hypothetical protein
MEGVSSGSKPYSSKVSLIVSIINLLLRNISAAKSRVPCGKDGFIFFLNPDIF